LATGVSQVGKKRRTGRGKAPLQGLSNDWFRVKGPEKGIIPTKALRIIQSPLLSDYSGLQGSINRRIAGTGIGQAKVRKALNSPMADELRKYISSARLGAAYED
ncbi:unnamed protein product, partial [marine sediment metagenome]